MSKRRQTVGILGATGLIGSALADRLERGGGKVIRFSRHPPEGEADWREVGEYPDFDGVDAVVNLAGESIARRWTKSGWERIVESRVGLTLRVVEAISRMHPDRRPKALLNASASGFYGAGGEEMLRECDPPGSDRLGVLCRDWEAAAVEAEMLGVRVVRLRTGIVLGKGGEAWERLEKVFRLGVGGRLGSGRQWMPWIALNDAVAAIEFALRTEGLAGPLNLSAPEPVRNRDFTRKLASALGRPAICHVPAFAVRLAFGGFGGALLASYRMVPERLLGLGFRFCYPELEDALKDLCS